MPRLCYDVVVEVATLELVFCFLHPMSRLWTFGVATFFTRCHDSDMMSRLSSPDVVTLNFRPLFEFFFLVVLFVSHDIPAKTLNLVKYP